MTIADRVLLSLHVEAVWGVKLPPIEQNEVALLPESAWPEWKLYAADLVEGRALVWRPDVTHEERAALLARMDEAWSVPANEPSLAGSSREVAFRLTGEAAIHLDEAQRVTRLLTLEDYSLLEAFWPGHAEAVLQPERRPLIGVVIDGHLLCLAHSSRRTVAACELGIGTLPQARRKGYALAATLAWSAAIAQEGLVPIYSALLENTPSLRLAESAGYRQFARGVTIK